MHIYIIFFYIYIFFCHESINNYKILKVKNIKRVVRFPNFFKSIKLSCGFLKIPQIPRMLKNKSILHIRRSCIVFIHPIRIDFFKKLIVYIFYLFEAKHRWILSYTKYVKCLVLKHHKMTLKHAYFDPAKAKLKELCV